MKKKILAFGASNSSQSINKKLAQWASSRLENSEVTFIDLNDFEMPIYSIDKEQNDGIPSEAKRFRRLISESDGLLISFAEHNGGFTVAFKNVFDWASRIGKDIWDHKPMMLMASSPGKRGGKSVLESAVSRFGFMGAGEIHSFSLPSFGSNFQDGKGIVDDMLLEKFNNALLAFQETI